MRRFKFTTVYFYDAENQEDAERQHIAYLKLIEQKFSFDERYCAKVSEVQSDDSATLDMPVNEGI